MSKADPLRELTGDELRQRMKENQDGLLNFRLRVTTGVVDNMREARTRRREIARIKTILRERERAASKQAN